MIKKDNSKTPRSAKAPASGAIQKSRKPAAAESREPARKKAPASGEFRRSAKPGTADSRRAGEKRSGSMDFRAAGRKKTVAPQKPKQEHPEGAMRLNKYIAHAGICSRREADELIAAGSVKVNGKVVTEMGYMVMPGDEVQYGGEKLRSERHRYFLLNKPVTKEDMKKLLDGIELEDGPMHVDDIQYAAVGNTVDKRVVGVELHSGRNRIVRRLFEALGYEVHKLDRTVFAGLTKKDLPRGRWRELTEKEVGFLKMI